MAVSTATNTASYTGNGVTISFSVPFYFIDNSHIVVQLTNLSSVTTDLVQGSDYTVSGAGMAGGGTIVTTVAPPAGYGVLIKRIVPLTQLTSFVANDPLPAATLNASLDLLTMEVQQLQTEIDEAAFPGLTIAQVLAPLASTATGQGDALIGVQKTGGLPTTQHLVNASRVFDVKADFGAKGDGTTDDYTPFANAVSALSSRGGTLRVPSGVYIISQSVVVPTRVAIVGDNSSGAYSNNGDGDSNMTSVLKPKAGFIADTALLDFRNARQTCVEYLGFDANSVTGVYALEYGKRTDGTIYASHLINRISIRGGFKYGIRARNASLIKSDQINVSDCTDCGVLLQAYCGDSEITDAFINGTNVNYSGSDTVIGTGLFIGQGSSNTTVRGGKYEYNARGIVIYAASGVHIDSQFDVNTWAHVYVNSSDSGASSCYGTRISGRFINGGTASGKDQAAISIYCPTGSAASVLINGASIHKAGTDAYDFGPTAPIGPITAGIKAITGGTGIAYVTVSGCDLYNCSTTYSVYGSGAGTTFMGQGNQINLAGYTDTGAVINLPLEQQWAPGMVGGSTPGSPTFSLTSGRYSVNGNMVTAWGRLNLSAIGGMAGDIYITGLPRTASTQDSNAQYAAAIACYNNITLSSACTQLSGFIAAGDNRVHLWESNGTSGAGIGLPNTALSSSSFLDFCVTYPI